MEVSVRLFAAIREAARTGSLTVELPYGATAGEAMEAAYLATGLSERIRGAPVVLAVNREQVDAGHVLGDGDELAVLPPVSGGAGPRVHAEIGPDAISIDRLLALVADDRAGAVVTFSGVTREVQSLEYEAYAEMALPRLEALLTEVAREHGLWAIAAAHRTGSVALGQSSVVIAASSAHRGEAFTGARAAIDRIKVELPIWKLERPGGRQPDRWVDGSLLESGR